ncbi:MAG: hypothetical protein R3F37_17520 [Candidatus Competibacteraceae bacterium]
MMVDGEAAAALGRLLRTRWLRATGERLKAPRKINNDPWPTAITPIMHNAEVAIARTLPADAKQPAVREVEQLYRDMIATAQRPSTSKTSISLHMRLAQRCAGGYANRMGRKSC